MDDKIERQSSKKIRKYKKDMKNERENENRLNELDQTNGFNREDSSKAKTQNNITFRMPQKGLYDHNQNKLNNNYMFLQNSNEFLTNNNRKNNFTNNNINHNNNNNNYNNYNNNNFQHQNFHNNNNINNYPKYAINTNNNFNNFTNNNNNNKIFANPYYVYNQNMNSQQNPFGTNMPFNQIMTGAMSGSMPTFNMMNNFNGGNYIQSAATNSFNNRFHRGNQGMFQTENLNMNQINSMAEQANRYIRKKYFNLIRKLKNKNPSNHF